MGRVEQREGIYDVFSFYNLSETNEGSKYGEAKTKAVNFILYEVKYSVAARNVGK